MVGRILLEKENGANRRQGRDRQKKQWSLMFMDCVLNLMRNRKLRNSPNDEVSTPVQRKHIKPKITLRKKVMCTLHDTNWIYEPHTIISRVFHNQNIYTNMPFFLTLKFTWFNNNYSQKKLGQIEESVSLCCFDINSKEKVNDKTYTTINPMSGTWSRGSGVKSPLQRACIYSVPSIYFRP